MTKWWMEAVGYQIYIKSFYDDNDDGVGDLMGIYQKLDYLKTLGVNLLWICPFYDSPMDDNGYDVRNFFDVSEQHGTLDDFKKVLDKAHKLGIKIILDFVLNHTSDEHPWFIESRRSLFNEKRDYYIWQPGRMLNGKMLPPTNWASFFGGSAWTYDQQTNQYYMRIFSQKMPDLNWSNPAVRKAMHDVGKWWLDLGIDGFRIDAVSHLDRADFKDSGDPHEIILDWFKFSNLPKVHTYLKEMNQNLFNPYDIVTIGEVGGAASIEEAKKYASFDSNELSMVFNFDHNWCNNLNDIKSYDDLETDVIQLKNVFNKWQDTFKDIGWLPLNWLNHDQPRLMSQYGNMTYFKESGKMLATALYFMRGTPFIYQGEEIGMTNYPFKHIDEFNDVASKNHYANIIEKTDPNDALWRVMRSSRDHPRTPMQWNSDMHAGFTKGEPWLKVNPNYQMINVNDAMSDQTSIWHHYQKIIDLRRHSAYHHVITYGAYEQIEKSHPWIYAYIRTTTDDALLVVTSFSKDIQNLNLKNLHVRHVILSNYDDFKKENNCITLRPFEAIVLKIDKE